MGCDKRIALDDFSRVRCNIVITEQSRLCQKRLRWLHFSEFLDFWLAFYCCPLSSQRRRSHFRQKQKKTFLKATRKLLTKQPWLFQRHPRQFHFLEMISPAEEDFKEFWQLCLAGHLASFHRFSLVTQIIGKRSTKNAAQRFSSSVIISKSKINFFSTIVAALLKLKSRTEIEASANETPYQKSVAGKHRKTELKCNAH